MSFRAYFGDYDRIVSLPGGRTRILPVSVRSHEENRWTFTPGR